MSYNFKEYEQASYKTASFQDVDYLPLGLTEEVGELVHEFARAKRTGVEINKEAVQDELGDVLWMLAQIARENGFTLEEAAKRNIEKLKARTAKGSIHDKDFR
jgi:NTP pyrophosphatase (non-canonical NTP hydrolase)